MPREARRQSIVALSVLPALLAMAVMMPRATRMVASQSQNRSYYPNETPHCAERVLPLLSRCNPHSG